MKMITSTYEERLVPPGEPLEMYAPDNSRIHVLDALPMGPDTLFKYVIIHEAPLDDAKSLQS